MGDNCPPEFVCTGNSQFGVEVDMSCVDKNSFEVMQITYLGIGESEVCAEILAMPIPGAAYIPLRPCSQNDSAAWGSRLVVRPDGTPECLNCVPAAPVQESTWGAIKSLYHQ